MAALRQSYQHPAIVLRQLHEHITRHHARCGCRRGLRAASKGFTMHEQPRGIAIAAPGQPSERMRDQRRALCELRLDLLDRKSVV